MNKQNRRLNQQDSFTNSILESISDGVFTIDLNWKITSFNRAAEEITGISRKDALGRRCCDVFRSSICQSACPLKITLKTMEQVINRSCFIIRADGKRIPISVSTAVLYDPKGSIIGGAETFRDLSEIETLRKELGQKYRMGDLISRSSTMRKVFDLIPAVANTYSTVLIQGETGTGKELAAKAIHNSGSMNDKPFIAINCGALPETLLESELFGYKKGAFTGAYADKKGLMEAAGNGTLFLDEIGDVSAATQVKLLRVIQEKVFQPLGSTSEHRFKARIITATNKNLAEMVKNNEFREDLFYRINVIRLDLPPLRQRKEDIPLLIEHFIDKFNYIYGKHLEGISDEALSLLMNHNWPGNVRELENVIERAAILCKNKIIKINSLPEEFHGATVTDQSNIGTARSIAESTIIQTALARNNYNKVQTAKELGIHKATLYRKIKKYGIENPGQ
ncbi:MAG: sigma-54 interaction domain-containing protein [Candidatus Rifleibacteriota bacterium]